MIFSEIFTYDAEVGRLLWKSNRPGRGCVAGHEAGARAHHGYRAVMVDGKKFYVHRIIWEIVRGPILESMSIDHIDGNRSNNKIENLRCVSLSDNQRNRQLSRNNRYGIQGVHRKHNGYAVMCGTAYIGHHMDFFEACCARKSAERSNGFHINHGRKPA